MTDFVRAVGGGLLIGLPLLYTQEMWSHAFALPGWKIVTLLAVAYAILVGYNHAIGFRRDLSFREVLIDSVEALGIGILVAFTALLLLGRIEPGTSLRDAVGKVALEGIVISFGAAIAAGQLRAQNDEGSAGDEGNDDADPFQRLYVAAGGALIFALNVAPTEEPVLIGIESGPWLLLGVVIATLLVTLGLVFYADFRGGHTITASDTPLDHPVSETLAAYAISLAVSWLLLWAFGRLEGASLAAIVAMTVALGVVASLGAAVGRLLLGGSEAGAGNADGGQGS
ncbi:MAG: TIGR02587 family membrane protein [Chloroflexi bacterium]|nr:TIGR02587 family membrane protein [Chloroflexota bacterium]